MKSGVAVTSELIERLRRSRAAPPLRTARDAFRATSTRLGIPRASDTALARLNGWCRKPPRVTVIVATIGRSTRQRTVDSASWACEVIVVYDAAEVPGTVPSGATAYACGPTGHWGAEQRDLGISRAAGTHIAFMDDDDVYATGVGPVIMRALTARPSRVHVFRMRRGDREFGGYGCVVEGSIGSPMFVVPNDGRLGHWSSRYAGDFDFISSTLAVRRRRPRYHPEVIAVVRPEHDQSGSAAS